ncbi:MAG: winged helix-turn-helix domain-containing protein [Nitrososphaerales archaeon]|jgi:DNA-binding HxlR family transcriptional regulator
MGAPDAEKDAEFNRTRAELFESIGHQTRIRILEAISQEPLTFSGLKKRVGIDSSGHLSFHLEKLSNLIKSTADGTYALTDDGSEALRLIQTVHGTETALMVPSTRKRPRSTRKLLGLAAIAVAIILVGSIVASAALGITFYNTQEPLQGSLHYFPAGWSTIEFNNSKGTTIGYFNFALAGANLGNQSQHERLLPLDLQIAHQDGTYLRSLQLQFSMGTACCLDVFFGTQRGYPWNPVQVNQASGLETINIADFGPIGAASVTIDLLLSPPYVSGNLSLSMSVQLALQGPGMVIGHEYTGQFTLPLIVEPDQIVVASGP